MRGVSGPLQLELTAAVTAAHWIGGTAMFALGDGAILAATLKGAGARAPVHDGAILCACVHPDGRRLVTGGDDGKLFAVEEGGAAELLLATKGKWIDHVAASAASSVIVAASGKDAIVLRDGGESHRFAHPSTIGGLALDAKGRRLAASHYGGVTLRYVLVADDKGAALKWAGSHLAVTMSPDGEYVVSAMQEAALHGWRMPDKLDLQMTGYPAKTRSFSWNRNGRWLATSGANRAVVWPFVGKLGPRGKEPLTVGEREALVTATAFHPSEETLAIGYADGAAILLRLADRDACEVIAPSGAPITTLAWRGDGKALAGGDAAGQGFVAHLG